MALLATQILAAPAAKNEARQFQAQLTFIGANPSDSYTLTVPTTPDSSFKISEYYF